MESIHTVFSGDSDSLNATSMIFIVTICTTIALYNAIELLILIFITFKRYHGLYFWSLLVASFGLIPYNFGFLVVFFELTHNYVGLIIDSVGWMTMITGQSVVLYSRLHLVLNNRRILRAILWMIVVDAIIFHIPTTVTLFGSNYGSDIQGFSNAFNVIEKIQMTGFCIQEFIISGFYIKETVHILNIISNGSARKTMWQLFGINFIIILMDIALLGIEYRNLFRFEQTFKGAIYSVKLKLEFAILGKLVDLVGSGSQSANAAAIDTSDFVDATHPTSDVTHAPSVSKKSSCPLWKEEIDDITAERVETNGILIV